MKVIVTRPQPDADLFAAELHRIGASPIVSPVMAIRHRPDPVSLAGIGALAFTSANGVRAFAASAGERSMKAFAVGAATAAAARAAGFSDIAVAAGDVESLAALIAEAKPPRPVLHLAGSERAGDLVAALAERNVEARRRVIYDAVEIARLAPAAARILSPAGESAGVVFFSPRSARLFLKQAGREGLGAGLRNHLALCLSPAVANAVREFEWKEIAVAQMPASPAMLRLVESRMPAERPQGDAS